MRITLLIAILLICLESRAQITPAQFSPLKDCTVAVPFPSESLTGDCTAYASPADAEPSVYDGTSSTVYTDPVFGTKIKRLTPQTGMPNTGYAPKYAPYQSWSENGTYLILAGFTGGGAWLLNGADPYTFIRQVALPGPFDGADEPQFFWTNTNDCLLFYVNSNKIQTINVCSSDAVTVLATFTTLTDTQSHTLALSNGCGGVQCLIKPKIYCHFSNDDTKMGFVVESGGGLVFGFGLMAINLGGNSASITWFHKYQNAGGSTGDFTVNETVGTGNSKYPGGACISDLGNYVHISWTTKDASRSTNISSISVTGGVVSVTAQTAWPAGVVAGATIQVNSVPLASDGFNYNGAFVVGNIVDTTHLTYTGSGTHPAVTGGAGSAGFVDYQYYGLSFFNASDGSFNAQISESEAHYDGMILSNGTEAAAGSYLRVVHNDFRRLEAFQFSNSTFNYAQHPDAAQFAATYHFSGEGTNTASTGLQGWGLVSYYTESSAVDCTPSQIVLCAEIDVVPFDGTNRNFRVAHHQSVQCSGGCEYYDEPHATPNRNFTKVIWGSDWRTFATVGCSTHCMDVFLVELPPSGNGAPRGLLP